MASRIDSKSIASEKIKMDMTPMIDVVFLLIIFFMCTIKFKVLDGKIAAYLPKDVGVNTGFTEMIDRLSIRVDRVKAVDVTDPGWIWDESQIRIHVGPKELSGLQELHDIIQRMHGANPDLQATFEPGPGTYYIDALKIVNECLRADFDQITFRGVPVDL